MNKTILILICWLLGWSSGMAQQRKMSDVQQLADSILNRPTKLGGKAKVKTARTERIIAASELLDCQLDAFYVCDAGEGGFAVISADERQTPILGFSHSESFDKENIPAGMKELLDCYAKEYEVLMSDKPQKLSTRHRIEDIHEQLGPIVQTQWGQNAPFNNRCPSMGNQRCLTGCVAVSSAQIMYFYNHPRFDHPDYPTGMVDYYTSGIHIEEDLSTFHFDWSVLDKVYDNQSSEESCAAIADLLYACGVAAKMNYGVNESSATSYYQVRALVENFGFDPDIADIRKDFMTTNEWQTIMVNELNYARPIIYTATSASAGGHSFIIDGYKADGDAYPFYHMNWGWKGYCDDFFKLSSMQPGNYDFALNHSAIINIKPDNCYRDAENIWQAEQFILSSARINPTFTHNFTLTLNKVYNHSYKTFSGKMEFYLRNEEGNEILVGKTSQLGDVSLNYGYQNLTINATLPNNIEEGEYTVVVYSLANGSDVREKVTCPSPISLTVTTKVMSYTPDIMVSSLLNVGENLEDRTVSIMAERPMNYAVYPFTGTISMAVADMEGNILKHFGTIAQISNLNRNEYINKSFTFTGKLPTYLEDGQYRLILAANQSGYQEWGVVTGFKVEGGWLTDTGMDLSIPFWLEDGKIIYHKENIDESELPVFYADLQVTSMPLVSFDATTRYVETKINDLANFGNQQFVGQLSMCLYNENDEFIAAFGNVYNQITPIGHYQQQNQTISFAGNLPEETEDGRYSVCIAAKQTGYQGWSPLRGCVIYGSSIVERNNDLHYEFIVMNGKMYKLVTDDEDGLMMPAGNMEQEPIYDLNGRQVQKMAKGGIYIIGGKKVVK